MTEDECESERLPNFRKKKKWVILPSCIISVTLECIRVKRDHVRKRKRWPQRVKIHSVLKGDC